MNRHSVARLYLVMLLSMTAFTVRAAGVHAHLCFDGQESPATIHLADAGIDDGHAPGEQDHQDLDLPPADGVAKSAKASADLPLLMGAAAPLFSLDRSDGGAMPAVPTVAVRSSIRLFRPPLRGPPLPTSQIV